MSTFRIIEGDCIEAMTDLPEQSVQTCVTSPPYWGLRDYGVEGQLGLEPTPEEYVANMVAVFREVRRVLRDDGTLWLNLGDSYAGARGGAQGKNGMMSGRAASLNGVRERAQTRTAPGLKAKDLVGIPWLVAFALRSDGWWLRSEIIWHKPNGIPGGGRVISKPDRFHEHIFLLTRSSRYFYDAEAISEPIEPDQLEHNKRYEQRYDGPSTERANGQPGNVNNDGIHSRRGGDRRNKRSVWKVATVPFGRGHFATFPPKLIEPCILAGSSPGDTVLDPFNGAGTTGLVALRHDRDYIGIELNPEYAQMARERILDDAPLLNHERELEPATGGLND